MSQIILTQEQKDIISSVKEGKNLRITARAGTGKTSTLVATANAVPKSALYLAFNKAMVEDAKSKFPEYVNVKTWHGLAYASFGHDLHHKLSRQSGEYRNVLGTGREIGIALKLKNFIVGDSYLSSAAMGLAVKMTVNKFENSSDTHLGKNHVSFTVADKFRKGNRFVKEFSIPEYSKIVLAAAKKLWKKRTDPLDDTLATHDTYLKLYQLSNPILDEYDIIYSDESQDSSDVMIDILKKQKCQIVVVGDSYQQIYSFRGSVNAMDKFDYETLSLTKSFRFGEAVAKVASMLIGSPLYGNDKIQSLVQTPFDGCPPTQRTIIYRTNSSMLFDACMFASQGLSVNIETDIRSVCSLLRSALALKNGDKKAVKSEELTPFNTWEEFEQECKNERSQLSYIYGIIKQGRALEIIGFAETYKKCSNPDITLTTSHKAKGLEWDSVVLADDFPEIEKMKGDELNLLYVAATRGKRYLQINNQLYSLVNKTFDNSLKLNVKEILVANPDNKDAVISKMKEDVDNQFTNILLQSGDVHTQDALLDMAFEDGLQPKDIPLSVLTSNNDFRAF